MRSISPPVAFIAKETSDRWRLLGPTWNLQNLKQVLRLFSHTIWTEKKWTGSLNLPRVKCHLCQSLRVGIEDTGLPSWAAEVGVWHHWCFFLPASTGDGARDYLSSRLWQIWASCLYEQALYSFRIWSIFSIKSQDEKKSHWSFWVSIKCCWNLSSKFSPYQWQWLKIRCAVHPPTHTQR